jgi:hypothetical protein
MNENFFIIPKPSKKASKDVLRYWRLDFHDIEKIIIQKGGFSKNIIRLLKVSTIKRERARGYSKNIIRLLKVSTIKRERGIFQKKHYPAS